jgi:ATP-dependent RNA helicase DeaD
VPTTFSDLGLRPELLSQLDRLGYEEPTPIQAETIPHLLGRRDLLGQAATGTGKTAAFALPILHLLAEGEPADTPRALVLAPTRELAMQVAEAVHTYGRAIGVRVVPVYGGQPIWRQLKALDRGVDVVVGTPGRVLDHLTRETLDLSRLETVVLDEADEMLDMGFQEDLEAILSATPEFHQTVLFSATMPGRIHGLVKRHLHEPVQVELTRAEATADGAGPSIRQQAYVVPRSHKPAALGRVLDLESPDAAIVFCKTRNDVDDLTATMNARGYRAEALHGGMTQQQRDKVMERLRSQTSELLVATDVAARGLDIDHLSHVVNYDVPSAPESYVHRIGRVGRAGREGVAITLVEPRQRRMVQNIERHVGRRLEVESLPSVADLHERRFDATVEALRARLEEPSEDHGRYRHLVERLADDADLFDVAVAAVTLLHEGEDADELDDTDIPEVSLLPAKGGKGGGKKGKGGKAGGRSPQGRDGVTTLWIGLGKRVGLRPKDVVGAIANESSVSGREIGNIDITPNFTLVEVPSDKADEVIASLRDTTMRGQTPRVKRDRSG